MDQQRRRPVLVEFWEITMPQSMRTLPYLAEWHERYSAEGLRVVAAHTPASEATVDDSVVGAAVERLGIEYPVLNDAGGELWSFCGATGYPTRYLWDGDFRLHDLQLGEGEYLATELMIQELLGVEREPLDPLRPEDAPGALVELPTEPVDGPSSGPYTAGGVWVRASGSGVVRAAGGEFPVEGPCAVELASHPASTTGSITIEAGPGVEVHQTVFTPGLAAAG